MNVPLKITKSMGARIAERHKSVARMVGYLLSADATDMWVKLPIVLRARLEPDERAMLAAMCMAACDDKDRQKVAHTSLEGAGYSPPPFLDPLEEAKLWASTAPVDELRAYLIAAFAELAPAERVAFLDFAGGRSAA